MFLFQALKSDLSEPSEVCNFILLSFWLWKYVKEKQTQIEYGNKFDYVKRSQRNAVTFDESRMGPLDGSICQLKSEKRALRHKTKDKGQASIKLQLNK